jgi:hypothetical protein
MDGWLGDRKPRRLSPPGSQAVSDMPRTLLKPPDYYVAAPILVPIGTFSADGANFSLAREFVSISQPFSVLRSNVQPSSVRDDPRLALLVCAYRRHHAPFPPNGVVHPSD